MLPRGRSDWQEWHPGIIACLCRGNSRHRSPFLFSSSVRCQADTVLDKGVSCRNLVTFSLSMKCTFWKTSGSCGRTTGAICNLLVLFHPLWLWGRKSTNMMVYKLKEALGVWRDSLFKVHKNTDAKLRGVLSRASGGIWLPNGQILLQLSGVLLPTAGVVCFIEHINGKYLGCVS